MSALEDRGQAIARRAQQRAIARGVVLIGAALPGAEVAGEADAIVIRRPVRRGQMPPRWLAGLWR